MKFIALPSGLVINLELVAAIKASPSAKRARLLFPASYTRESPSPGGFMSHSPLTLAWMDLDEEDSLALVGALSGLDNPPRVDALEKAMRLKSE